MDRALLPERISPGMEERSPLRWVMLPGLCCQAAGGDPEWADDLSSAWFLFYSAAHLMDSIEDRDDPHPWWAEIGPGAAINVASGLYFSASLAINSLNQKLTTPETTTEVTDEFYRTMLAMCAGQQRDLDNPTPELAQYWQIAAEKSGLFFALACRSGARLATQDSSRINGFNQFGHHLGVLIQVLDDLAEWQDSEEKPKLNIRDNISRTLPVIYALEVMPPTDRFRLREILQEQEGDERLSKEFRDLVEGCGAPVYMMTEIEHHTNLAKIGLEHAAPLHPAGKNLVTLLDDLVTKT